MSLIEEALQAGEGILRLKPAWVPRTFMMPGGRLRLHPSDLYALGAHRGGINERWFSSTTNASNGPGTPEDEGLSYVAFDGKQILLKEAIESFGEGILGQDVMEEHGGWNVLCKFFDNLGAIPHHMHQSEKQASLVGQHGKPESYYFPPQYNLHENNFPFTFMGLEPGTRPEDVRGCLARWNEGDNGILYLSKAYRLQPGTGWQIDPGVLHAPGSLVTYEPQVNSDVFAMFQSMVDGRPIGWELLVKDVPPPFHKDLDYLVGLLDWEANVDERFGSHNLTFPRPVNDEASMKEAGYREVWVSYGTGHYSAKELTVYPGRTATIRDSAAYGLILTQGFGEIGVHSVETPTLIRYGQMTSDELFVCADAAGRGVVVSNHSQSEPLVLLKHFGPGNPDAEALRTRK
jgi:hypothetical protein